MGTYTTKPIKELSKIEFKGLLTNKNMIISPHAFDHLAANQRKVFKEEELTNMLKKENPRKVYLQQNGRYAAYYRKKDGYRKLIIQFEKQKAIIISFMDPPEIPKIKL